VVTQEGSPSLAGWPASFDHVLGDARLRDFKPELEQFTVDARRAAKRIFDAHGMSDQELAVQAISETQQILEEYLQPIHHDNGRLLDRLVEVLERPSVLVAVDRLKRGDGQ
jgi:hypothetical protein